MSRPVPVPAVTLHPSRGTAIVAFMFRPARAGLRPPRHRAAQAATGGRVRRRRLACARAAGPGPGERVALRARARAWRGGSPATTMPCWILLAEHAVEVRCNSAVGDEESSRAICVVVSPTAPAEIPDARVSTGDRPASLLPVKRGRCRGAVPCEWGYQAAAPRSAPHRDLATRTASRSSSAAATATNTAASISVMTSPFRRHVPASVSVMSGERHWAGCRMTVR